MLDLLAEMNWTLIFILIAVSAIVAYMGDLVGMRVGKKRVSIFGLRPKSTSSIITIFSGVLITILTLAVLTTTSQTVRTAIFSMKFVQRQITELTSQLQGSRGELEDLESRLMENQEDLLSKQLQLAAVEGRLNESETRLKEIGEELETTRKEQEKALGSLASLEQERDRLDLEVNALRAESERLREGLEYVREGRIIIFVGEMIAQTVVLTQPGDLRSSPEEVKETLMKSARTNIAMRSGTDPEQVVITLDPRSEEMIRECCAGAPGRTILRLIVAENTVQGEPVKGSISLHESRKIYDKGYTLAEVGDIPPALEQEEAEMRLFAILRTVNSKAQKDGVLPDPLRGTVGNISASEFFEAVDLLTLREKTARVIVKAEEDIYTEGPVRVEIVITDD